MMHIRKNGRSIGLGVVFLAAVAGWLAGTAWEPHPAHAIRFGLGEEEAEEPQTAPAEQGGGAAAEGCSAGLPDFTALTERVSPEVVNISSTSEVSTGPGFGPPMLPDDPFWEPFKKFFGPRRFQQRSLGSGFVIGEDGLILTNNHVIEDAAKIVVTLNDERKYDAEVVGRDSKTDIALIRIKPDRKLRSVKLGDSDELKVGEWVIAIGNPFGLSHTVTAGIVSAKSRYIGQGNYDDFIQTDAAINPGNSGGPLINMKGEVVGINTAIFSRTGGNIGIGFAIPINLAKELLPELREKGRVTRGWLGVYIQKVTPEIAESLGLDEAAGALVADVMKDSPAEKAGVQVGDVIIEYEGRKVEESNELPRLVARTRPGRTVRVKVIRNGKVKTLEIEVGVLKDEETAMAAGADDYGLRVQTLTPALAESLGLEEGTKGVVVVAVEPGSPADEAGLRRGDLILQVDRKEVEDEADFRRRLAQAKRKSVLLLIQRGGNTLFLAMRAPEKKEED